MNIKNYFAVWVCLLLSTLTFTACSDDDDDEGGNSSFTVDGESCPINDASCSFVPGSYFWDDLYVPGSGSFSIHYTKDGDPYYLFDFSIEGLTSKDEVALNKNYVADGSVDVNKIGSVSNVGLSTEYYDEGGKLSITEVGSDYVVVSFESFTFVEEKGSSTTKHTINGKVKFYDINAD